MKNRVMTAIVNEVLNPNAIDASPVSTELITNTGLRPLESAINPQI